MTLFIIRAVLTGLIYFAGAQYAPSFETASEGYRHGCIVTLVAVGLNLLIGKWEDRYKELEEIKRRLDDETKDLNR